MVIGRSEDQRQPGDPPSDAVRSGRLIVVRPRIATRWTMRGARPLFKESEVGDMVLDPGGIIAWLIVGAIAGWLAGLVLRGGGFGIVGDVVVGLVGALIGGFVFGILLPGSSSGVLGSMVFAFMAAVSRAASDLFAIVRPSLTSEFLGSLVVAFVGAVIFVALLRALRPSNTTRI